MADILRDVHRSRQHQAGPTAVDPMEMTPACRGEEIDRAVRKAALNVLRLYPDRATEIASTEEAANHVQKVVAVFRILSRLGQMGRDLLRRVLRSPV
jgi:hypothetical protein